MPYLDISSPLWKVLEEVVHDEGLRLYDVERLSSKALRIYIERERDQSDEKSASTAAQGGVTSDDCSRILRRLMVLFAAEGPTYGLVHEPEIEVSSPGINRHLRLPEHFASALGERVKVSLSSRSAEQAGRALIGNLIEVESQGIAVRDEGTGESCRVRLDDVAKARIDFKF